jgi:glycosyltransferase involved in cell wall biosynthesis
MHEGWGLSVIEANSYGCPAVAYDVPGLRVAIRNQETGLLAHSDGEFREAIALLLRNPELRAKYGEAAKQWAARFDWETAAKDTLLVLAADDPLQSVAPYTIQTLVA